MTGTDAARALSVVVPVKDEADNVVPLVEEIVAALERRFDYEIVFVDDGSADETPARLAQAQARCPRLRVLRHRRSCGQSTAIRTGVLAARRAWVATLDGDGQNDPADIAKVLAAATHGEGAGLAIGWRAARRDGVVRRVSSRVANRVRRSLLGDRTPDTGCGLKVFTRDGYLALPFFDHQHRFLPALFLREGARVVSVPVAHRPRRRGRSKYGLFDRLWVGIVDLFGVLWLQRRATRPQVEGGVE